MRAIMFGLGILAMVVAALLALRDNTAHVSRPTSLVAAQSTLTVAATPVVQATTPVAQASTPVALTDGRQDVFFVRAGQAVVGYDISNGSVRFALPRGLPSADWKRYYTVRRDRESTALTSFDLQSGRPLNSFVVTGQWDLVDVSATGRWLALEHSTATAQSSGARQVGPVQSQFEIVDAIKGRAVHSVNLAGDFAVDAISDNGNSLFLIEYLRNAGPEHYAVRLYDLANGELLPDPLVQKGNDEQMAGEAWSQVASPDGNWLLTLYLNTDKHEAFIHTLDLINKYPVCIDLPSEGAKLDALEAYALTLSPDGRIVYATNPTWGVVVQVSLETRSIMRTVKFPPRPLNSNAGFSTQTQLGSVKQARIDGMTFSTGVVSRDGRWLYFSSGEEIWGYDTGAGTINGPYDAAEPIAGLGLSADGKQLYVANGTTHASAFDIHPDGTLARSN